MKGCEGQISIFDIIEPPKQEIHTNEVGIGVLFRYLRYGPHTLVPEARNKCKAYLDSVNGKLPKNFVKQCGDPKKWHPLPCLNCEHFADGRCRAGGHTCHYEYDVLICDAFKQTIIAKPKCKYSGHVCNKENLWRVADTLDCQEPCPHICCRQCSAKLCGARCNGSEVVT